MKEPALPYPVPKKLEPNLARVLAYWQGLKRKQNDIPFWDDVRISSLPDLAERLMLIDVFVKSERFRWGTVGRQLTDRYGESVAGKFLDEIEVRHPFEYLLSQCSATVESGVPTYYRHVPGRSETPGIAESYSRLVLPLWGDGHVGMLFGAIDPH